jgi:hypothetical protein
MGVVHYTGENVNNGPRLSSVCRIINYKLSFS